MIKSLKKTKFETRTSFTRKTAFLYPKRSKRSKIAVLIALFLMGMGPSLGASTYSSSNLSSLLDSLKLKEPYKTEALFSSISSGALGPEVVDRYSPHAAFFLGIH